MKLSDDNFTGNVMKILKVLTSPCELHPNQLRTLYCREAGCLTPICANCAVKTHKTHDFVDISDVVAPHRTSLVSSVETIATAVEGVTKDRERVRSAKNRLDDSLKVNEQEIAKRAAELNEVVAKRRQDLQEEIVNCVHLDQMNNVSRVDSEVCRGKEVTGNVMAVCRELATRGSDVEVCNLATKCIVRARQLLDTADIQLPKPVQLTFMPSSDLETTFKSQPEKLFGTVEANVIGR